MHCISFNQSAENRRLSERIRCGAFRQRHLEVNMEWTIYIPDEGDWPINYTGTSKTEARAAYLKWANRKRLPAGAVIFAGSGSLVKSEVKS